MRVFRPATRQDIQYARNYRCALTLPFNPYTGYFCQMTVISPTRERRTLHQKRIA